MSTSIDSPATATAHTKSRGAKGEKTAPATNINTGPNTGTELRLDLSATNSAVPASHDARAALRPGLGLIML